MHAYLPSEFTTSSPGSIPWFLCSRCHVLLWLFTHYSIAPFPHPGNKIHMMGYKRWVDPFIRGHSPGDSANLESGPFQASQVGRKLFLKSISLIPNSQFAVDGHRSSSGESLRGSGHSPDLDAEILPALTVRMMSSFVLHVISSHCL